ncbi:hypothetical protein H5410_061744 [Solanum commersonii]|uniref:Uncharacterized protein n=1 Tax=Solanum commersonii TaxID=4109 RepID=A0A9J5W8V6_SOLCO|nr:hypothetical protein H5410_061744 [Solanum commersonii]
MSCRPREVSPRMMKVSWQECLGWWNSEQRNRPSNYMRDGDHGGASTLDLKCKDSYAGSTILKPLMMMG